MDKIDAAIEKRKVYDVEQLELERLRKEAVERELKERDERIAADAVEAFKAKEVAAAITEVIKTPKEVDDIRFSIPEKDIIQENMQRFGGSFVQALGVALTKADSFNTARIKNAFPDYWEEYLNFKAA